MGIMNGKEPITEDEWQEEMGKIEQELQNKSRYKAFCKKCKSLEPIYLTAKAIKCRNCYSVLSELSTRLQSLS